MARRGDLNGWWRFGVAVVGAVAWAAFRIRVRGADRVPAEGPAIVAGNHVSALDGVALALVVGRRCRRMTRFLVAAEFFDKRRFGWALRSFRQIPLRRGKQDSGALEEAARTIRSGAIAGIFPEGRVNADPGQGLQRGRSGLARIALATGAPVVPVGIWGTHHRYPKSGLHLRRPWRPTVALSFGPPVPAEGDPGSFRDLQRFTERLMRAIGEQVEEARRASGR
jgi:1-acyl-sn-glycerol-3-phosphate acyltransferase